MAARNKAEVERRGFSFAREGMRLDASQVPDTISNMVSVPYFES